MEDKGKNMSELYSKAAKQLLPLYSLGKSQA